MIRVLTAPLLFVALLLQSIRLAMGQIWANKMRSTLTTIGIVIGVASVTAVIAALTGLKTKVLKDFETLGTNKIFIVPDWPREGKFRHFNWRLIRFQPKQFEGLLERCPSIEDYTLMANRNQSVHYGVQSIEGAQINGINPSWHRIENRSVIAGRPFTLMDEENGWQVCLVTPEVRDELRYTMRQDQHLSYWMGMSVATAASPATSCRSTAVPTFPSSSTSRLLSQARWFASIPAIPES